VQHAGEDGALDGKLKTAVGEQLAQHRSDAEPLPDPPEQQRPADPRAGNTAGFHIGQRCYGASGEGVAPSSLQTKPTGVPHASGE